MIKQYFCVLGTAIVVPIGFALSWIMRLLAWTLKWILFSVISTLTIVILFVNFIPNGIHFLGWWFAEHANLVDVREGVNDEACYLAGYIFCKDLIEALESL